MMNSSTYNYILQQVHTRKNSMAYKSFWQRLHLDPLLLLGLFLISLLGLAILYSAAGQDMNVVTSQATKLALAFLLMMTLAQIPPWFYKRHAPWLFGMGITLLCAVLVMGHIGNGAQRWLNVGLFRFQPSEIMKLSVPIILAWYLDQQKLPPEKRTLIISATIILLPSLLIAKQPDLGTALVIMSAGACVLLLAGISWRFVTGLLVILIALMPFLWHVMHQYQRQRVLTFLNPERDPLGTGYHIIQSKIAIGSGGMFGKGWLHGSQSHLHFLPEHATDFIFALLSEEFGLLGCLILLLLYAFVIARGLYIANMAQDTFSRLLAGSLSLTFFVSVFINIGMVTGILPVVGLPLPLISYGGTSMVTLLAGFGILMSIQTHRRLVST